MMDLLHLLDLHHLTFRKTVSLSQTSKQHSPIQGDKFGRQTQHQDSICKMLHATMLKDKQQFSCYARKKTIK